MKALMLGSVLAVGMAVGLLAPATAEAGHRHSRHCGHGYGYSRGRYYAPAPYYGYGYGKGYYRPYYPAYGGYYGHRHFNGCGHGGYGYGYGYPYAPGYVVAPPPVGYCVRPGVSIHLGF
jgi:hypothetical protein